MGPATLSDDDLLRRMAAGDEEAFAALYRRRQAAVYRFALQMSGSTSVAEEVAQEAFLALIRGQYDASKGSLVSWLFGVARNQVLRTIVRDRRYQPIEDDEEAALPSPNDGPLDDLTRGEALDTVRQAVLALPPHYREAVVLCDLQELTYEQAAEALNCAAGTVRSRLHRGRAILRGKLRSRTGCIP